MKKLIVLVAFLAISFSSFAQFEYGGKVFANASTVNNGFYQILAKDHVVPYIGGGVGLYGEFKNLLAPRVGLKGELLVNFVGEAMKIDNQNKSLNRLTYLNIPILVEYKVANDKLTFEAGPQFGLCLGATNIVKSGASKHKEPLGNRNYNFLDFSVAFGASYLVYQKIGIEARYNIGVSNVYTIGGEASGNNRFFTLGVIFGL